MVRYDRVILLFIAVAVSIPAVMKTRQSAQSAALTGLSVSQSPAGFVRIEGDVLHPGMYPLSANMVTAGVIKMAVPSHVLKNLIPKAVETKQLKNGDDIRLSIEASGRGDITIGSIGASERIIMGIPLNINTMVVSDFDRLPGIGPVVARRIVEYRQKNGGLMVLDELLDVKGIGPKKYEIIKKF